MLHFLALLASYLSLFTQLSHADDSVPHIEPPQRPLRAVLHAPTMPNSFDSSSSPIPDTWILCGQSVSDIRFVKLSSLHSGPDTHRCAHTWYFDFPATSSKKLDESSVHIVNYISQRPKSGSIEKDSKLIPRSYLTVDDSHEIKMTKKSRVKRVKSDMIFRLVSSGNQVDDDPTHTHETFYIQFGSSLYLGLGEWISETARSVIVSTEPVEFILAPYETVESVFFRSPVIHKFRETKNQRAPERGGKRSKRVDLRWRDGDHREPQKAYYKRGQRVRVMRIDDDGYDTGVIQSLNEDGTYVVDLDIGDADFTVSGDRISVHGMDFSEGDLVDAYWPADRLKKTSLFDVFWPAEIEAVHVKNQSYRVAFDDGSVHPSVPQIWVRSRVQCKDNRTECLHIAARGECSTNPSFAMVHCRRSCRVCTVDDQMDGDVKDDYEDRMEIAQQVHDLQQKFYAGENVIQWDQLSTIFARVAQVDDAYQLGVVMNLVGEYHMVHGNITMAELFFEKAANTGNGDAQFNLAHIYTLQGNDGKAILNLYFASAAGNVFATLTLGYRHLYGHSVHRACNSALSYYKRAAQSVIDEYVANSHTPTIVEMIRLDDKNSRDHQMEESQDVLQYWVGRAENGDLNAQFALGQLRLYGLRGVEQDVGGAVDMLNQAAEGNHPGAMNLLGQLHLTGQGVKKNSTRAKQLFFKAVRHKNTQAMNSLGRMYLNGHGVRKNLTAAFLWFKTSALQGDSDGQFMLGQMHFYGLGTARNHEMALRYYQLAGKMGHTRALFESARMFEQGLSTARSCKMAVKYYKIVAERSQMVGAQLKQARKQYLNGNYDVSLYLYSRIAEMGYEVAQTNAAWLLSRHLVERPLKWIEMHLRTTLGLREKDGLDLEKAIDELTDERDRSIASFLTKNATYQFKSRHIGYRYYMLSAQQNNPNSQRIVGDYHYYNWPIAKSNVQIMTSLKRQSSNEENLVSAADFYQKAADATQPNAQALFNLGYMHQYGLGRKQDYEMAKRYYDRSIEVASEAYAPASLALLLLKFQYFAEKNFPQWFSYGFARPNKGKQKTTPTDFSSGTTVDDQTGYATDMGEDINGHFEYQEGWFSSLWLTFQPWIDEFWRLFDEASWEDLVLVVCAVGFLILILYRQRQHL